VTSRNRIWIVGGALLGAATISGCTDSNEDATPTTAAPVAQVTPVADADRPNAAPSANAALVITSSSDPAAAAETEDASAAPQPADQYQPPFPDRVDLFVAPKRQGAASGQDSSDQAVELMGFVRVDRSRAILTINGETNALAEGESVGGIEVISVQPPSVVLRRGRQRWQATIE
jgi:hypothetical protein